MQRAELVRAAAEAYLRILMETKSATGVDGCPMDVARKALAAVIEDMQTRVASESGEVRNVSLGAVAESDCSKASSESCSKK